jgi:hypothetical protein
MRVPYTQRKRFMRMSGITFGAALCALLPSTVAFAAGDGYAPSGPPPSAAAGGFTKIVTTKTILASGGKLEGSANGATAIVIVPAGALPSGGQVVLSEGALQNIKVGKNLKVVADFSVVVLNPNNGARLSGPWKPAMTVTIHDSSIKFGDKVVVVVSPGHVTNISRALIGKGLAYVAFTSDPNFAVVSHK